jgi:hypothetical protein
MRLISSPVKCREAEPRATGDTASKQVIQQFTPLDNTPEGHVEQARQAEIRARQLQREGLLLNGSMGRQALGLAQYYTTVARSSMRGARHG